ncbi:hypothetical protein NPIL_375321 [Nephila pilipes]|uniref:Uncharacterized protein n=1 Tax=Nephila pilipes TaxID=299642 RepID=A0A8X6MVL1_NEPPI|nr:hypothetical protein NPIL_375321 [Nephila pilipes]
MLFVIIINHVNLFIKESITWGKTIRRKKCLRIQSQGNFVKGNHLLKVRRNRNLIQIKQQNVLFVWILLDAER